MKKASYKLLSSVVAISFISMVVGCQPTPKKKAKTVAGKTAGAGQAGAAAKTAATEVCSADILSLVKSIEEGQAKLGTVVKSSAEGTKSQEAADLRQNILKNCSEVKPKLEATKNKSCLKDEKTKTAENSIYAENMNTACVQVAKDLKEQNNITNSEWINVAVQTQVVEELEKNQDKLKEEFANTTFELTSEGFALTQDESRDFKNYLKEDKIESDQTVLQQEMTAAKKAVCSVTNGEALDKDTKYVFKISNVTLGGVQKAKKEKLNLPANFKNMFVNLVLTTTEGTSSSNEEETSATAIGITCVNLDASKTNANQLKNLLAKVLKTTTAVPAAAANPGATPAATPATGAGAGSGAAPTAVKPGATPPAATPAAATPVATPAATKPDDKPTGGSGSASTSENQLTKVKEVLNALKTKSIKLNENSLLGKSTNINEIYLDLTDNLKIKSFNKEMPSNICTVKEYDNSKKDFKANSEVKITDLTASEDFDKEKTNVEIKVEAGSSKATLSCFKISVKELTKEKANEILNKLIGSESASSAVAQQTPAQPVAASAAAAGSAPQAATTASTAGSAAQVAASAATDSNTNGLWMASSSYQGSNIGLELLKNASLLN